MICQNTSLRGNSLSFYDETLNAQPQLREEISQQIRGESVDDHASKALYDIRMNIQELENEMKQKAESVIRSNRDCMADSFYTTRSGRICVPVKKEYRYKIAGSVIDKSGTGSTVFVEPEGVTKLGERLQLLRIEEENEVYRIFYTLTAMVADCAETLTDNMRLIEKLDYSFSKGKLSLQMRDIMNDHYNQARSYIDRIQVHFPEGTAKRTAAIRYRLSEL